MKAGRTTENKTMTTNHNTALIAQTMLDNLNEDLECAKDCIEELSNQLTEAKQQLAISEDNRRQLRDIFESACEALDEAQQDN